MKDIIETFKLAINKVFPFMELPLTIVRQGQFPLDKSSLWWDLEEAKTYAKSNPIAYVGQPITVVNEDADTVTFYLINSNGDLVEQGGKASVDELKKQLEAHKKDYDALKQAHDQLKQAHDKLQGDHNALSGKHDTLQGQVTALEEEFDSHVHTADQITETATRVFLSPAEKTKLQQIAYATQEDIDELFPELKEE